MAGKAVDRGNLLLFNRGSEADTDRDRSSRWRGAQTPPLQQGSSK